MPVSFIKGTIDPDLRSSAVLLTLGIPLASVLGAVAQLLGFLPRALDSIVELD